MIFYEKMYFNTLSQPNTHPTFYFIVNLPLFTIDYIHSVPMSFRLKINDKLDEKLL